MEGEEDRAVTCDGREHLGATWALTGVFQAQDTGAHALGDVH